jgi:membrane associated rhomboid family serine protease
VAHCYRHPDREAGRHCTRCGRPACGDCLVQAAVGSHCLECAKAAKPDVRTRAKYWSAGQRTLVTYALIAANVAVFLYMLARDSSSLLSGREITKVQFDLGLYEGGLKNGEWYRLVTAGFLHFGIIHIGFNMLLLYQLGQLLEPALGRSKFALLYFAALLAGSYGAVLTAPNSLTGGASGAVFGLMGAAAVGLHRRGINVFSTGIGTTLLLNLVLTFSIAGISIGGHLGGVAAGAICGWVMLAPGWKPMPAWTSWGTPLGVLVLAVGLSVVQFG